MSAWRDWIIAHPDSALVLIGVIASGMVTLGGAVLKLYLMWKNSKGALNVVVDAVHKNDILESSKVLSGAAAQIKEDVKKAMDTLPTGQQKAIQSAVDLAKKV